MWGRHIEKFLLNKGKFFLPNMEWNFMKSAKESINVSEAFIEMSKEIIKNSNKKGPSTKKNNVVVSNAATGKSVNSREGCC